MTALSPDRRAATAPSPGPPAVSVRALTKRYGGVAAVDGIDLDVPAGSRFGLLGPNGSGKTTLVRMLLGLIFATSGEVEVLGRPMPRSAAEVLPRVGALVEGPAAYPGMTARKNLRLLDAAGPHAGRPGRTERVEQALATVGLEHVGRKKVRAFSLGMRQRLGLAAALLHGPELLLLDEPTNGLDPAGIRELRDLLIRLNEQGTTVVLSSHLLSEIEALCTDVALLSHGRLAYAGSLESLRPPTGRTLVGAANPAAAQALLGDLVVGRQGELLVVADPDAGAVNARLVAAGLVVTALEAERRTLEDVVVGLAPGEGL